MSKIILDTGWKEEVVRTCLRVAERTIVFSETIREEELETIRRNIWAEKNRLHGQYQEAYIDRNNPCQLNCTIVCDSSD